MNKKKYKRIVLLLKVSSILLVAIGLVAWTIYWWIDYKTGHLLLAHKNLLILFITLIMNFANLFIQWFFRKSAIKRELFRTLTILTFIIIIYFVIK